jgi:hypothetical protein
MLFFRELYRSIGDSRVAEYILEQPTGRREKVTMFENLFNGIDYKIVRRRIGEEHDGWMMLDPADTLEGAYAICKKDWDFGWSLRGITPSRQINVIPP